MYLFSTVGSSSGNSSPEYTRKEMGMFSFVIQNHFKYLTEMYSDLNLKDFKWLFLGPSGLMLVMVLLKYLHQ